MPPFKLNIECAECAVRFTGYYPGVLLKADRHAAQKHHKLVAYRNGKEFCTIEIPASESW